MPASEINLGGMQSDDWQMLIYNFTNMQNSDLKEQDYWATSTQQFLTDISPILIILSFGASLFAFGVLKYNYLADLFSEKLPSIGLIVAVLVSVVSELLRFGFGLAGVRDLVRGKRWNGILGIGASVILSIYDHFEAGRMAAHWGNEELWYVLVFLVWVALVAEIRLIMTMSEKPAVIVPLNEEEDLGNGHDRYKPNLNGQGNRKPNPV